MCLTQQPFITTALMVGFITTAVLVTVRCSDAGTLILHVFIKVFTIPSDDTEYHNVMH